MENKNLVAFVYMIIRDYIPPGILIKIIEEIKGHKDFIFTNKHIQALAEDLAERLEDDECS